MYAKYTPEGYAGGNDGATDLTDCDGSPPLAKGRFDSPAWLIPERRTIAAERRTRATEPKVRGSNRILSGASPGKLRFRWAFVVLGSRRDRRSQTLGPTPGST